MSECLRSSESSEDLMFFKGNFREGNLLNVRKGNEGQNLKAQISKKDSKIQRFEDWEIQIYKKF